MIYCDSPSSYLNHFKSSHVITVDSTISSHILVWVSDCLGLRHMMKWLFEVGICLFSAVIVCDVKPCYPVTVKDRTHILNWWEHVLQELSMCSTIAPPSDLAEIAILIAN